ncbi:hypothetical protein SAMD00019534_077610 [Acytostelium subglobosum LB1]|uniref:hypothetical protein n=1 Tax=Acytostelium subglobosum LB1 TaxID=1410327 RepID=UPI000644C5FB|nr:hypothetical protein SAMD00019534_077610 [Acytostelium subglobosum LB1]GAM24586.1 hypothetical protein SAMD00019534_077610 [Acytostelium subglobosum LB1]|eukprot:XP_012752255.1 hypothetical protein SAMD00019534_077610 [Acytostelium subglobosum LB1]
MGIGLSKRKKVVKSVPCTGERKECGFINGKQYKLVMLGQGGVGKTSISIRFVSDRFVADYDPTVEDAYKKDHFIDGKEITLEILDTAGQEEYTSGVQDKSIRVGEGFVCIYSIASRESFQKLKELREKILWAKDAERIPMIIVGNKSDMEKERQVPAYEGKALADEFRCPFIETSAKTNNNIKQCIELVLKEVIKYNSYLQQQA